MSVKRYELRQYFDNAWMSAVDSTNQTRPSEKDSHLFGEEYVLATDYAALEAENERLRLDEATCSDQLGIALQAEQQQRDRADAAEQRERNKALMAMAKMGLACMEEEKAVLTTANIIDIAIECGLVERIPPSNQFVRETPLVSAARAAVEEG